MGAIGGLTRFPDQEGIKTPGQAGNPRAAQLDEIP